MSMIPEVRSGIRRREQQRELAPLVTGEEQHALGPGGVHDGSHVVHSRLQRWQVPEAIREARASLVEHEHTCDRGDPFDVPHEQRLFPGGQEIAGQRPHEDEVVRPIPHDLVRDRDIAATGVLDVRNLHVERVSHR